MHRVTQGILRMVEMSEVDVVCYQSVSEMGFRCLGWISDEIST